MDLKVFVQLGRSILYFAESFLNKIPVMLVMLKDLIHHKGYANASLLKAIQQHKTAAQDTELRKLLHHIILANRFWLRLSLELPFAVEEESRIPESLEAVAAQYRAMARHWTRVADSYEFNVHLERFLQDTYKRGWPFDLFHGLLQFEERPRRSRDSARR